MFDFCHKQTRFSIWSKRVLVSNGVFNSSNFRSWTTFLERKIQFTLVPSLSKSIYHKRCIINFNSIKCFRCSLSINTRRFFFCLVFYFYFYLFFIFIFCNSWYFILCLIFFLSSFFFFKVQVGINFSWTKSCNFLPPSYPISFQIIKQFCFIKSISQICKWSNLWKVLPCSNCWIYIFVRTCEIWV